jgi:predicted metalloprotease
MRRKLAVVLAIFALLFTFATPAHADFADVRGVSQYMIPQLNSLWDRTLQNYHQPRYFTFYDPASPPYYSNPCNPENSTQGDFFGAFYCPANEGIYFSYPFVQRWLANCPNQYTFPDGSTMPWCYDHDSNPNTTGDYAFGVALAHEWAHHVQNLMGWPYQRRQAGQVAHFELHADCLAGIATRYLQNKGAVSQDDLDEAIYLYAHIGDKAGTPWYDAGAHGSPGLRIAWFQAGINKYSVAVCNRVFN